MQAKFRSVNYLSWNRINLTGQSYIEKCEILPGRKALFLLIAMSARNMGSNIHVLFILPNQKDQYFWLYCKVFVFSLFQMQDCPKMDGEYFFGKRVVAPLTLKIVVVVYKVVVCRF